jgi:hypothetical protein
MTDAAEGTVTRGKTASTSDGSAAAGNRVDPEQRAAAGKAVRATTPLEAHAEFQPGKERDPVGLLLSQAETRVPELVPIRHGRMLVSPFTFHRGPALVMAADLDTTPTSGLRTQLCGDAHLSNFGAYASPSVVWSSTSTISTVEGLVTVARIGTIRPTPGPGDQLSSPASGTGVAAARLTQLDGSRADRVSQRERASLFP